MFAMYPFDYNCGNDYFGVLPTYGRPTRKNPWTRRTEAYYSPTHVDLANLRELERRRAEEEAQERRRQQQQLQEERRQRLARERAYRQWLADRERERNVFGSPFGRRPFDYDDYVSDDDDVGSDIHSVAENTPGKRETSESAPMPAVCKLDPDEAARRIARFLRRSTGKLRMTRILAKLRDLRALENRLGELYAQRVPIGQLTFDDERPRKVLPVSADNKAYLGYEEAILRTLDELDRVQSEGAELVRDLRRAIVSRAQRILDDLDAECDRQWTEHSQRLTKEAEENIAETHESQTEAIVVSAERNNDNNKELERKHDSNQVPAVDVGEGDEITDANDVVAVAESAESSNKIDESAATDNIVELSLPEQEVSSTTRAKVESDSNFITQLHELSVEPMEQVPEDVESDGGDDMVEVTMRDAEDDQAHREEDDFVVVDNPLCA